MSKWYGKVGYEETVETTQDVWEAVITERYYAGDVQRHISRWDNTQKINDDQNVNVEISLVADPYAYQHFSCMKYVEFMDSLWKISSIDLQFPRLILSIGGVYNREQN